MTIIETTLKACASHATQILLSSEKKKSDIIARKKTFLLQQDTPHKDFLSDVQQNFLIPPYITNNHTTLCEEFLPSTQSLQVMQMSDNNYIINASFADMSKTPETYQNFTQFLRENFDKNQNIHSVSLKIQDNFFSVDYQDTGSTNPIALEKKIYDISNDELRINNTEGICYRHKINGKYVRLTHLEECPNISILVTGDNNYVLFPSKSYIEKQNANIKNTNHSFKEAVLNNTPQDQQMLKEMFYVISHLATKDSDIKIIDTQTKENKTSFRVSIQ